MTGESFFVRHAYFTGGDEPYEKLKRALRAEIDRLGTGEFDGSERQRQILVLLARIVAAELDYRARTAPAE